MGDCTGDYIGVNEGSQDKGAHKQNVTKVILLGSTTKTTLGVLWW